MSNLIERAALTAADKNALLVKILGPRGSNPNRTISSAYTASLIEAFADAATEKAVRVVLEELEPVVVACLRWHENGHMKGCYHADYPEKGSPNCQSGCQKLRTSLAHYAALKGELEIDNGSHAQNHLSLRIY